MSRAIPPQLRRQVWESYMKKPRSAYGPCFVCENEIHILQFECGHVRSHRDGGELKTYNLRPICGSCNKSMGTTNLLEYKATFFDKKHREMHPSRVRRDLSKVKDANIGNGGKGKGEGGKGKVKGKGKGGKRGGKGGGKGAKEGNGIINQMFSGLSNLLIGESSKTQTDQCGWILKKGPRKGQRCDKAGNYSGYCSNHSKAMGKTNSK